MAGVLFIVCVPRAEHEKTLKSKEKSSKTILRTQKHEKTARLIDELKGNRRFGSMKSSIESFTRIDDENILKHKSTEFLPTQEINIGNSNVEHNLYKSRSEEKLAEQKEKLGQQCKSYMKNSWEEIKSVITPKKDKITITPELDADPIRAFHCDTPLETILTEVLARLKIKDAVWCPGKENNYYQVFFSLESGCLSEEAIQLLNAFGIGTRYNSVVSVIPCALYYHANNNNVSEPRVSQQFGSNDLFPHRCGNAGTSAWSKFVSSVRARNTLAQVVHDVRAQAALTFDWLFLLIVAAFVSAIGLIEDSTVILVASMLISPLMGPITASTMGTAVRDRSLQRIGVLHELLGLFLALLIGFLFGLVICAVDERYGEGEWPTNEMMSRCELRSLWVGALVAVPSGAGVALAVLGEYTASLVGVAISASLLPPAVNAGLLWAMALIHLVFMDDETRFTTVVKTTLYSQNPAVELAVHGTVSLCLTIVNIICIFVTGVAVYKIKEVAPIEPKNMQFWRTAAESANKSNKNDLNSPRDSVRSQTLCDIASWDYLRWYSMTERVRLTHATWSPQPPLPPPRAQEIEDYCRRAAKEYATQLSNKASTVYRSNGPGYKHLASDSSIATVDETKFAQSSMDAKRTKFVVTPALDPLYGDHPC